MPFAQLAGHGNAVALLKQSIAQDTIAHAYLFHGSAHTGKTLAAECFAAALNCDATATLLGHSKNPKKKADAQAWLKLDACGKCNACIRIQKKTFTDVREVSPVKKFITIEQIRELIDKVYLRPLEGPWKVFIISEAEKMHHDAASALLKTLEEPPEYTVLILLSSQPSLLFPTLVSRCQKISFDRTSFADAEEFLQKTAGQNSQARLLARLCFGQIGIALKLGEKLIDSRDRLFSLLLRLMDEPSYIVPRLAEDFEELSSSFGEDDKENLLFTCDMLILIMRDLLLSRNDLETHLVNADKHEDIKELSMRFTLSSLIKFLELLHVLKQNLWNNAQVHLCLQAAFFQMRDLKND